jgi:hypothetical protein
MFKFTTQLQVTLSLLRCNCVMTQATRIYKHSAAGTDWAALMLGAGLGLTLALQATTLRAGDFRDFYSVVVTVSRLAALVGTYLSVVGIFLVARIPVVERGVGHDRRTCGGG